MHLVVLLTFYRLLACNSLVPNLKNNLKYQILKGSKDSQIVAFVELYAFRIALFPSMVALSLALAKTWTEPEGHPVVLTK